MKHIEGWNGMGWDGAVNKCVMYEKPLGNQIGVRKAFNINEINGFIVAQ